MNYLLDMVRHSASARDCDPKGRDPQGAWSSAATCCPLGEFQAR
jgi:hypothetical protein